MALTRLQKRTHEKRTITFMSFPPEVRDLIYRHITHNDGLYKEYCIVTHWRAMPSWWASWSARHRSKEQHEPKLTILIMRQLSRGMQEEVEEHLRRNAPIYVKLGGWETDTGVEGLAASRESTSYLRRWRHIRLGASVGIYGGPMDDFVARVRLDLRAFLRWWPQDIAHFHQHIEFDMDWLATVGRSDSKYSWDWLEPLDEWLNEQPKTTLAKVTLLLGEGLEWIVDTWKQIPGWRTGDEDEKEPTTKALLELFWKYRTHIVCLGHETYLKTICKD